MRIGILDNYDSFTYNLVHYLEPLCDELVVYRNDEVSPEAFASVDALVLSPGPQLPKDAGILLDVVARYAHEKPILGICLGMQAIVNFFGGTLFNLDEVMHGRQVEVELNSTESRLFSGIESKSIAVGLYHSWGIRVQDLPSELIGMAEYNRVAMAIRHERLPITGFQFHPESIMTPDGKTLLKNWMNSISPSQDS